MTTWIMWIMTSLLLGITAKRLTGRLSLGIVVQALSFTLLNVAANEPMTPDLLVTSMQALAIAICVFGLRRWPEHSLAALGAIVGALLLSKVNSGAFALIAVAYAAIVTLPRLRRIALLRWGSRAVVILMGPMLMYKDLGWSGRYALLGAAGGLALVLVAWISGLHPDDEIHEDESSWWTINLLRGLILALVGILGAIFILGTSPRALFETLIVDGSRQRLEDPMPAVLTGAVVWWAAVGVVCALLVSLQSARLRLGGGIGSLTTDRQDTFAEGDRRSPSPIAAIARLLAGLAIWCSLVDAWPIGIAPNAAFALALPLAWVAAVPSGRDDGSTAARFLRLLVPALAIMNALFAYPVAGSQVWYASTLFVLCGAVCVADGLHDLQAYLSVSTRANVAAAGRNVAIALTVVLALIWTLDFVVRPIDTYRSVYRADRALPFPGATRLRLEAEETAVFTGLIADAKAHCRALISLPGLPSLNLWSGLPEPNGLSVIGVWWKALLPAQLATALESAEAAPGLCEIRDQKEVEAWSSNPLPRIGLVRFLQSDFVPIGRFGFQQLGYYELMVRKDV